MECLALDENGYGPILGPLVVTGIAASSDLPADWPAEIYDSKRLFSSVNKLAKIERIALSIFKISNKTIPKSVLDIFDSFENTYCSEKKHRICFQHLPHLPLCTPTNEIERYSECLSGFLEEHKILIESVNVQILCVSKFNELCRKNLKKDFINYTLFEKIILQSLNYCDNLMVKAGKIGGRKTYTRFLKHGFSHWRITEKQEDFDNSTYLIEKNNKKIVLSFLKDIEQKSFLGTLAGICGKYVRELFMTGINKYFGNEKPISGYRDSRTAEFVRKLHIENPPDIDCVLRIK